MFFTYSKMRISKKKNSFHFFVYFVSKFYKYIKFEIVFIIKHNHSLMFSTVK